MRAIGWLLLVPSLASAEPAPSSDHVELEVHAGTGIYSVHSAFPSTIATEATLGVQGTYVTASGLAPTLGVAIGRGDVDCVTDAPCLPEMVERSVRATVGLRYIARPGFYLHAQALWSRTWALRASDRLDGLGGLAGLGWTRQLDARSFLGIELDALGWRADRADAGDPVAIGGRLAVTLGLAL